MNSSFKILISMLLISWSHAAFAQQPLDTLSYFKDNPNVYSLIVVKNDQVRYQHFFNNHTQADIFNDQSLTKSVMSLLIGIAIDKGYIRSADEKISAYFPELLKQTDKRKQAVTIRQIMNQASGLYHEDLDHLNEFLSLPDPSAFVLSAPMVADPGTVWHYNNAATHLLSVMLTKATKMPTQIFARQYLFEPLGIRDEQWMKMRDGYADGSGLLSLRLKTSDLIKVGQLILHSGKEKNIQVVPASWIKEVLNPSISYSSYWGFPHSTYSLCFYHFTYQGKAVTYGMGWGGQFLVVIPDYQAVVAINQNIADAQAIKQSEAFITSVFPAVFKQLSKNE